MRLAAARRRRPLCNAYSSVILCIAEAAGSLYHLGSTPLPLQQGSLACTLRLLYLVN
jgi:hypothetical protein